MKTPFSKLIVFLVCLLLFTFLFSKSTRIVYHQISWQLESTNELGEKYFNKLDNGEFTGERWINIAGSKHDPHKYGYVVFYPTEWFIEIFH
jgi:hypothetical protein